MLFRSRCRRGDVAEGDRPFAAAGVRAASEGGQVVAHGSPVWTRGRRIFRRTPRWCHRHATNLLDMPLLAGYRVALVDPRPCLVIGPPRKQRSKPADHALPTPQSYGRPANYLPHDRRLLSSATDHHLRGRIMRCSGTTKSHRAKNDPPAQGTCDFRSTQKATRTATTDVDVGHPVQRTTHLLRGGALLASRLNI